MARRYYTCPIRAIYMAKEFGVKIVQRDNYPAPLETVDFPLEEMINDLEYWDPKYEMQNRLYVKEESEHIFEPKIVDWGYAYGCCSFSFDSLVDNQWSDQEGLRPKNQSDVKIIMRQGKHFIDSEIEEKA